MKNNICKLLTTSLVSLVLSVSLLAFSTAANATFVRMTNVSDVTGGVDFFNVSSAADIYGWFEISDSAYLSKAFADITTDILGYRVQIGDILFSSENQFQEQFISKTAYLRASSSIPGSDLYAIFLDMTSMFDNPIDGTTTPAQVREINNPNGTGRVVFRTDWEIQPAGVPLNPGLGVSVPEPSVIALLGVGLIGFSIRRHLKQ